MRLPIAFAVALLALGCSKDPAPGGTDFARGGVPDDSVKTAPIVKTAPAPTPTFTVARTGIPDDSIKTAPVVKPTPAPTPTFTAARVGTNDDSVKPVPKPAPAPTPR